MAARNLTEEEKKILTDLRDKHDGLVKPFLVKDMLVVVRAASDGELHRYKEKLNRSFVPTRRGASPGVSSADAERELALSTICHPDRELVKTLLTERAGFIGTAAAAAEDLASSGVEEIEGN